MRIRFRQNLLPLTLKMNSMFQRSKAILPILLFCCVQKIDAQTAVYDSLAIQLLDRVSDILGDLSSCEVTIDVSQETADPDYGKLTHFSHHKAIYSGNNKFFVKNNTEKDDAGYWFNGNELYYYSFARNQYGRMEATGQTTLEVVDAVHRNYGVDFPAIDFFYPSLTDDLIAQASRIEFFGLNSLGKQECYKIAATGPNIQMELWLQRSELTLPLHVVIVDKKTNLRYEAHYTNWEVNQVYPDAIFNFAVPPDATSLTIIAKTK